MATRTRSGNKRTASQRKSDRRKANLARKFEEHVLSTIDGAAQNILDCDDIGSLMPSESLSSGGRHLFQIVRVDVELDAVYGVIVERCPMPWWKWNRAKREGLVDDGYLEEFNRTSEG